MATMKNSTSSSSSSINGRTYDVFISFRGKDTRLGFTGYLYKALCGKGISTFIDDEELEPGAEIAPALVKAIQTSRIALVIFSEHYASSAFCLEELAKIMERSQDKGMLVFPVFYLVEPSDVRYQKKGSYAEAFRNHEAKKIEKEKIKKWSLSLSKAADLNGWHFKADSYEYEVIEKIIQEVSKKIIGVHLDVANYPVGLESRVQKVNSLLHVESSNGVRMVGIYGIGGIGKTTLARAVYNSIAYQFESLCFLDDIAENSMKHGLVPLQETLLCKSAGEKDIKLLNLNKGSQIIKSKLCRKRVLLVLDNVDKLEQIKALAGGLDWFGLGSRIIITTRHEHLLHDSGVKKTYEVEPLNHEDALELFSWNAFLRKEVIPSYEGISKRVIQYSNYLPSSLELIGLGFRVGMLSKEKLSSDFDSTVSRCNSLLDAHERTRHESIQEIPHVRDSDKDKINSNVDEKDNGQHLRVDLSRPGAELRLLEVFYHSIQKGVIYTISLPKQSAVEDVTNYLKSKVNLSHPGAELRLLRVFRHKILKIFSPNEKIENINDQFGMLRAEEESHCTKSGANSEFWRSFLLGYPYAREWMFAVVIFDRPEYLKDSDIVSTRFEGRDIYGAWKYCYLGLEQADNAP